MNLSLVPDSDGRRCAVFSLKPNAQDYQPKDCPGAPSIPDRLLRWLIDSSLQLVRLPFLPTVHTADTFT